jgi:hypothetical protein
MICSLFFYRTAYGFSLSYLYDTISTVQEQVVPTLLLLIPTFLLLMLIPTFLLFVLFFYAGYSNDDGRRELLQAYAQRDKMKGFCSGTDIDQYMLRKHPTRFIQAYLGLGLGLLHVQVSFFLLLVLPSSCFAHFQ